MKVAAQTIWKRRYFYLFKFPTIKPVKNIDKIKETL